MLVVVCSVFGALLVFGVCWCLFVCDVCCVWRLLFSCVCVLFVFVLCCVVFCLKFVLLCVSLVDGICRFIYL